MVKLQNRLWNADYVESFGEGLYNQIDTEHNRGSCNHAQYQKNYRSHENMELQESTWSVKADLSGEFIQRSPFVDSDCLTGCCRSNAVISDR